MKLIIFFLFALINISYAQWEQISTIGNNELRGVKFFNEHTGIVVGQGGIWRSTNSGMNWIQVLSGIQINYMSFPNTTIGYAVGDSGKVFKSIDAGVNWSQIGNLSDNNLYGVSFVNTSTGYVVGQDGISYRTVNGGNNWFSVTNSLAEDLFCVLMTDNMSAVTVGTQNKEVYGLTNNGGANWATFNYSTSFNLKYICQITGAGDGRLEAVGTNGRIRRTTDFGVNWTIVSSNTNSTLNFITFTNNLTGYIVGNTGVILRTTDSGLNWISETSGTSEHLRDASFINATTGWTVGTNGTVIRTGIPVGVQHTNSIEFNEIYLFQNSPNPFNSETNIVFNLSKEGHVSLSLYDLNGKQIKKIINGNLKKGNYRILLSTNNLSSGIYFYELQYSALNINYHATKKLMLIK